MQAGALCILLQDFYAYIASCRLEMTQRQKHINFTSISENNYNTQIPCVKLLISQFKIIALKAS